MESVVCLQSWRREDNLSVSECMTWERCQKLEESARTFASRSSAWGQLRVERWLTVTQLSLHILTCCCLSAELPDQALLWEKVCLQVHGYSGHRLWSYSVRHDISYHQAAAKFCNDNKSHTVPAKSDCTKTKFQTPVLFCFFSVIWLISAEGQDIQRE